jgi:sugar/nucleoside kinase (ribokinase family)
VATAPDIIVSGHLCLDLIPSMGHVPLKALGTPGRLFEVGPLAFSTGGAVSNTGLALHRLGVDVGLMAAVGDDLVGQAIISFLNHRDPALSRWIRIEPNQSSSYTIVLSPENVDRIFLHCACTNSIFGADSIDYAQLAGVKLFHLGYPPILPRLMVNDGEELEAIYRRVKATGVISSLDTSLPDPMGVSGQVNWEKLLRRTLPFVDIFIPSIGEILFMLRRNQYDAWSRPIEDNLNFRLLDELASELLDMGVGVVGFKLGHSGFYVRAGDRGRLEALKQLPIDLNAWANKQAFHPAFHVHVAGTTGAGDSAYAGLLAAMLRGYSLDDTVQWACAVGACNVEAADATSGIRTWDETVRRLNEEWPTRPHQIK